MNFDPGVGGGGFVLDHFDDGVGLTALALEVERWRSPCLVGGPGTTEMQLGSHSGMRSRPR